MATIKEILLGLKAGLWNFCFPETERRKQQRQMEYVVRKERLDWEAYHSAESGVSNEQYTSLPLVVSLTSHENRVMTVHRVIESLFHQSLKPNKIVLYLGQKEFQSIDQLPLVLQRQIQRGLEVRFVRDQRSYTKLLPALREFPESVIVTVDDDILYPFNVIERLVNAHRKYPKAICSLVNRTMQFTCDGRIVAYNDFPFDTIAETDVASNLVFPEGFGGVLYPPHCFTEEVFNESAFMRLAPTADDLWFKAMSLVAGTPVVKVHSYFDFVDEFVVERDVQDSGLRNENLYQNKNNNQLKALFQHYNLYQYLHD